MTRKADFRKRLLIYGPIAVSLFILGALVWPNLDDLLAAVYSAKPFYLFCSLLFAFTSYLCMGLSLWEVLKILGHRLPFSEAFGISFVSTTVNYFVSSAASAASRRAPTCCPSAISLTASA